MVNEPIFTNRREELAKLATAIRSDRVRCVIFEADSASGLTRLFRQAADLFQSEALTVLVNGLDTDLNSLFVQFEISLKQQRPKDFKRVQRILKAPDVLLEIAADTISTIVPVARPATTGLKGAIRARISPYPSVAAERFAKVFNKLKLKRLVFLVDNANCIDTGSLDALRLTFSETYENVKFILVS